MPKNTIKDSKNKLTTRLTSYSSKEFSQLRKSLSEEEISLYVSSNLLDMMYLLNLISSKTYWKTTKAIEHNKIRYYNHKNLR
jgi:hypothetical protein